MDFKNTQEKLITEVEKLRIDFTHNEDHESL